LLLSALIKDACFNDKGLRPCQSLTWIKDGGHVVMEEVPERVNSMLAAEFD
jgi:hypothetical protein